MKAVGGWRLAVGFYEIIEPGAKSHKPKTRRIEAYKT